MSPGLGAEQACPSKCPTGSTWEEDGPSVGRCDGGRSQGKPQEMASRNGAESDGARAAAWGSRVGYRSSLALPHLDGSVG